MSNPQNILCQKWEDVIVQQSEMINIFLDDIDESFGFLSEAEQEDYLNRYQYNLYMFQSFCYPFANRFPELGGQSMNLALATKGMILNSGIEMRQLISQSGDTLAMSMYNQWIKNKEKLAKEYSLPPSKRITGMESLEKKTNTLEKDLHRITSAMNSNSKLIRVKWQDVQNHLKENEVAIEFTHFTFYDGKDWTDSIIYIALVITKNAEYPKLIRLGEEKEIKQLLNKPDAFSSMQYVSNLYTWPDPDFEEQTNGEKLFELFWQPIEPYLQEGNVIYFSPTGYLNLISFSAIPNSENTYISDKYGLVQTSSVAVITDSIIDENKIKNIVAFGGIRYDASDVELTSVINQLPVKPEASTKQYLATDVQRGDNWNYLPATLTEVNSIYNKAERNNIPIVE
ncbi:MAG: CHAT domain-containing protein, partial [Chitinophagales bacterium]|nr:CHAT domain-containing protein [Chitinophagales bacterium]